ncbi:hypothetical protein [Sphingomonas sp. HMP6]|uniref:hypothetical protein n=1 Tax=Sphingomonas sp. HMP6 TaxID=1517551 RepID=UPI001E3E9BEF|nr:hypothetical protein [Sphingomonas sp. HMP6]
MSVEGAPSKPVWRGLVLVALTYVVAVSLFFRKVIASGFDRGFSDRADGIIEISILEHWRNVLAGASTWNVTNYFHPYPATLGYNDGYFLYGLVYAFWRLLADPFLADTLNIATFKTIGFFAAYLLVARSLRWGRGAGLLVAFLFTNANGLMVQAGHAQLQSIALLPVALLLAVAIPRAEREGRRMAACAAAAGLALLLAAWLFTAFYMAWFTIFFGAVFAVCWAVTGGRWRPIALLRVIVRHHLVLEVGGIVFAIAVIPFLTVYLPKARETGGQMYQAVLHYLVRPLDPINVGTSNYVWGWLIRSLGDAMTEGEHNTGLPLLLFTLGVAALWQAIVRRRALGGAPVDPAFRAFAAAILLCWLLTIRIGSVSAWSLVYDLVPGAKGMRVVLRFQLFLILPVLLLVVGAWRRRAMDWSKRRPIMLAGALALLIAEQFGSDVPVQVSRSLDGAALWSIPAPPKDCASFFVVTARRNEPPYINAEHIALYPHNVDAMLLAEHWRLPTINGFSTFNPPDWNFADPAALDYDSRIAVYAVRHGLTKICRLDVRAQQVWSLLR